MISSKNKFKRRQLRVRSKIVCHANGKPRLTIFRANCHIYAQIIDDNNRSTLVSASTIDKELQMKLLKTNNVEAAKEVGKLVAERALKSGIKDIVFDRGGYIYHGRLKALADAARAGGLSF